MQGGSPEAPRDRAESAFTPILRRLTGSLPSALATAFVDQEGECVDYVSRVDPYEAKVNAAHLHGLLAGLGARFAKLGGGETFALRLIAAAREAWVQRVSEEYTLIVVFEPGADSAEREAAIALACAELRQEGGLVPPRWEHAQPRLSVRVRPATGWTYAPQGYLAGDLRVTITDVIGRWTERGDAGGNELVCFRVRTDEGRELTLVHDPDGSGWIARD